jgi:hypothetical protein
MASTASGPERFSPKPVTVNISADLNTKSITVDPDPFHLSLKKTEEAVWVLNILGGKPGDTNSFTVHFGKNGSPFNPDTTFGNSKSHSGVPTVQSGPAEYKYTITVAGVGALDPGGVIDR